MFHHFINLTPFKMLPLNLLLLVYTVKYKSNQIKSNHFYCHIITAHVLWWVKFLRACSRQCRNNIHIDSTITYLQTYTDDNVQYTHTYTQYTQCTIRHTYSYQYTLYTVCTHYTLCRHILYTHTIICKGAVDYTLAGYANVMDVHWMVSSGSR